MSVRFDEIELFKGPDGGREPRQDEAPPEPAIDTPNVRVAASRSRRVLAFATDASLFVALGLALSPLLNVRATLADTLMAESLAISGFGAFLLLLSYYYFVASWIIWGKTVGGSIFDTHVASGDGQPIDVRSASVRWCAMLLSIFTGGLGFLVAILPGGRSLADRMSRSRSYVSQ